MRIRGCNFDVFNNFFLYCVIWRVGVKSFWCINNLNVFFKFICVFVNIVGCNGGIR